MKKRKILQKILTWIIVGILAISMLVPLVSSIIFRIKHLRKKLDIKK